MQRQLPTPRLRSETSEKSSQLELDKLRAMLNNKDEELQSMQEKYEELEK